MVNIGILGGLQIGRNTEVQGIHELPLNTAVKQIIPKRGSRIATNELVACVPAVYLTRFGGRNDLSVFAICWNQ